MLSGYGTVAVGRLSENIFKSDLLKLPELSNIHAVSPEYSYPLFLKIAEVSVRGKQDVFMSGTQVLSFDLSQLQTVGDMSVSSLSSFQQLIFQLSRKSKTVTMRFDPSIQMAEIRTNQLLIETYLPEGNHTKKIFPELLTAKATSQLLQAVECGLNTVVMVGESVSCGHGTLEKKDDQHLYFDRPQPTANSIPQWQVQINNNNFVELTNGTSRLTLTVENGVIVKGDVVPIGEPSDTESGKNSNGKKSQNRNEKAQASNNSPRGSHGSSISGSSSNGGDDDDDDDEHKRQRHELEERYLKDWKSWWSEDAEELEEKYLHRPHSPDVFDRYYGYYDYGDGEAVEAEEEEEAEGYEGEENGIYHDEEERLFRQADQKKRSRSKNTHSPLSKSQQRALEQQNRKVLKRQ